MNPLILVVITITLFVNQTSCNDVIDVSLSKIEEIATQAIDYQNNIAKMVKQQDAFTKMIEDCTRTIELETRNVESMMSKALLLIQDAKNITTPSTSITVADSEDNQLVSLSMPKPPITLYPIIPAPSDDELLQ
jgi:hypothetical protein